MEIALGSLLAWLAGAAVSILLVFLSVWLKNISDKAAEERGHNLRRDNRILELEKQLVAAENKYVTETQLRVAIQEAFEPYKEDNREIKAMLRGVGEEIARLSSELAVIYAIRGSNRDDRTGDNSSTSRGPR